MNGQNGLAYIAAAITGKIMLYITTNSLMQGLATIVTVIGGLLAAMHYCVLLYDRFFKKQNKPS